MNGCRNCRSNARHRGEAGRSAAYVASRLVRGSNGAFAWRDDVDIKVVYRPPVTRCNWSVMLVLHRSRLAAVLRGWPVYLASPCPCPLPPRRGARRSLLAPGRIGTAKRAGVLLLRVHAGLGVNFCSAFRPDGCPAAAVGVSGLDFLGVFHEAFWISSVLEQVSEPYRGWLLFEGLFL